MSITGVDLRVGEGVPHTGLYTSDQGSVKIGDLILIKIREATIRAGNNVGTQLEAGKRTGTTYAGNIAVTGSITRAYLNLGEARLASGYSVRGGVNRLYEEGGVIGVGELIKILQYNTGGGADTSFPLGDNIGSFYTPFVDVELEVNKGFVPRQPATEDDPDNAQFHLDGIYSQRVIAKKCLFNNYGIAYADQGIITSGPLTFTASYSIWERYLLESVPDLPSVTE